MKIVEVRYGRTRSRNYQGERLELAAAVEEGENPDEVLAALKAQVTAELFPEELEMTRMMERDLEARKRNLGLLSPAKNVGSGSAG